jgi:hypothetical protein
MKEVRMNARGGIHLITLLIEQSTLEDLKVAC